MQFRWKKIGLPCLMDIHENEILRVKLPTICMELTEESTVVADDGLRYALDSPIIWLLQAYMHKFFFINSFKYYEII